MLKYLVILFSFSIFSPAFSSDKKQVNCQFDLITEKTKAKLGIDFLDNAYLEYSKTPGLTEAMTLLAELADKIKKGEIKVIINSSNNDEFFISKSVSFSTENGVHFDFSEITLSESVATKLFLNDTINNEILFSKPKKEMFNKTFFEELLSVLATVYVPYQFMQGKLPIENLNRMTSLYLSWQWLHKYNSKLQAPASSVVGEMLYDFVKNEVQKGSLIGIIMEFNVGELVRLRSSIDQMIVEMIMKKPEQRNIELNLYKKMLEDNQFEPFFKELGKNAAQLLTMSKVVKAPRLSKLIFSETKLNSLVQGAAAEFQELLGILAGRFEKQLINQPSAEEVKKYGKQGDGSGNKSN